MAVAAVAGAGRASPERATTAMDRSQAAGTATGYTGHLAVSRQPSHASAYRLRDRMLMRFRAWTRASPTGSARSTRPSLMVWRGPFDQPRARTLKAAAGRFKLELIGA